MLPALCVQRLDRGLIPGCVGEEQLQQALVAELEDLGIDAQPRSELLPTRGGEPINVALAAALRARLALDQAGGGEPAELRIDLPVARGPEEPRRLVH